MRTCNKEHRHEQIFSNLPVDQGGRGRHKCAGCAYDKGFDDGSNLKENIQLDFDNLPESQAGNVRHKSPHAAYALGYLEGVNNFYAR